MPRQSNEERAARKQAQLARLAAKQAAAESGDTKAYREMYANQPSQLAKAERSKAERAKFRAAKKQAQDQAVALLGADAQVFASGGQLSATVGLGTSASVDTAGGDA